MIDKIPKKGTCLSCDSWRRICVLPAVVKMIVKIILQCIREISKAQSIESRVVSTLGPLILATSTLFGSLWGSVGSLNPCSNSLS